MKIYGLRVLVGLIAFGLGLSAVIVWFFSESYPISEKGNLENVELAEKSKELEVVANHKKFGQIEIRFLDFIQNENGIAAKFKVENNTKETIYYSDYESQEQGADIFPLFESKVNGVKIDKGWCGTGLTSFPIKSYETKIFQVPSRAFINEWKKGKKIQIGFSFSKGSEKDYRTIWSENLPISDEIETLLSKEKEEFEKLIKQ